jgi:hypothetical protein
MYIAGQAAIYKGLYVKKTCPLLLAPTYLSGTKSKFSENIARS